MIYRKTYFLDRTKKVLYTNQPEKENYMDSIITKFVKTVTEIQRLCEAEMRNLDEKSSVFEETFSDFQKIDLNVNTKKNYTLLKSYSIILQKIIESCSSKHYFLDNLDNISEILISLPFNTRERFHIILYFIQKNIDTGCLEREIITFNLKQLMNHSFHTISKQELRELNERNELMNLVNSNPKDLTRLQRKQQKEITKFARENSSFISVLIPPTRTIKECYFDKKDCYTEDDIAKVIDALITLEVDTTLCESFKAVLTKDLQKRKAKEKVVVSTPTTKKTSSKNYLTDKEYKNILKETKKYFDLYHMQAVRPLNEEEIYYCANLYIRLGIPKDEVCNFFRTIAREQKPESQNPITEFTNLYDKLTYYADRCHIQENLKTILDYFKELVIATDENYEFWKQNIQEELYKIYPMLPEDYSYEYDRAKQQNGPTYKKD